MKILVVGDEESRKIWDYYEPGMLNGYDLILSIGDLSKHYLEFLATMSRADVLYVRGNHDETYINDPPGGCICIEDRVYVKNGLRIAGLGGSMKYKDSRCMFTEKEMEKRVRKLGKKIKKTHGLDILLTHAPMKDFHDGKDLPHQGFQCFYDLIDHFAPAYLLYGHIHRSYGSVYKKEDIYKSTRVINGSGTYELTIEE